MGFTKVKVEICNPKIPEKSKEVGLLADTGAMYSIGKYEGYASIIFGINGDRQLLGVTALEEMGLQVDPITKQLKPIELLLL